MAETTKHLLIRFVTLLQISTTLFDLYIARLTVFIFEEWSMERLLLSLEFPSGMTQKIENNFP